MVNAESKSANPNSDRDVQPGGNGGDLLPGWKTRILEHFRFEIRWQCIDVLKLIESRPLRGGGRPWLGVAIYAFNGWCWLAVVAYDYINRNYL